jgi:hypothetical protein
MSAQSERAERWTAGPWSASGNGIGGWDVFAKGDTLCICQRADWPHYAETSAANAVLIAAAPDLFAALAEALPLLENCDGTRGWNIEAARLAGNARATLARARGEQP